LLIYIWYHGNSTKTVKFRARCSARNLSRASLRERTHAQCTLKSWHHNEVLIEVSLIWFLRFCDESPMICPIWELGDMGKAHRFLLDFSKNCNYLVISLTCSRRCAYFVAPAVVRHHVLRNSSAPFSSPGISSRNVQYHMVKAVGGIFAVLKLCRFECMSAVTLHMRRTRHGFDVCSIALLYLFVVLKENILCSSH
jgi:hypothetical protein